MRIEGNEPGTKNTHRYRHRGRNTADLGSVSSSASSVVSVVAAIDAISPLCPKLGARKFKFLVEIGFFNEGN